MRTLQTLIQIWLIFTPYIIVIAILYQIAKRVVDHFDK